MTRRNQIRFSIIIAGCLLSGIGLYSFLKLRSKTRVYPSASLPQVTSLPKPSASTALISVVYGKVTDTQGQPIVGIIISIGTTGIKTDEKGTYKLTLYKAGSQRLTFDNSTNGERYQIADSFEQSIYIPKGVSLRKDFSVEKLVQ
jgi:hypothetical protein